MIRNRGIITCDSEVNFISIKIKIKILLEVVVPNSTGVLVKSRDNLAC
jgi:hypothetical protein